MEYQNRIHRNFLKLRINNSIRIGDRIQAQTFQKQYRPRVFMWYDPDRQIHTSSGLIDANLIQYHAKLIDGGDGRKFRSTPAFQRRAPSIDEINRITISDVRSQAGEKFEDDFRTTTEEEQEEEDAHQNNDEAAAADTSYLLTPMYNDLLESVSATESGGDIHIQNNRVNAKQPHRRQKFECPHCPKVYQALFSLKRHQRKHDKELQSPPDDNHEAAVAAKRNNRRRERAQYICSDSGCDKVFGSIAQLRRHCREHEPIHKCPECGKKFQLLHDYSWHVIECTAERDCQREKESLANGGKIKFAARRLRSQCSSIKTGDDDGNSSVFTDTNNSLYSQKQKYIKIWRSNNPAANKKLAVAERRGRSTSSDRSSIVDRYDASESEFSHGLNTK